MWLSLFCRAFPCSRWACCAGSHGLICSEFIGFMLLACGSVEETTFDTG